MEQYLLFIIFLFKGVQTQPLKIRISLGGSALFAVNTSALLGLGANKNAILLRMKTKKKNVVLLLMALAVGLLLPMTIKAQQNYDGSRGLFMRGANVENNNCDGSVGLGGATQENPTEVPLSSGIIALMAAGISYATIKRKEDKK